MSESQSKEIANYADSAMFRAQSIDRTAGPRVFLLSCNNDPLGSIAAAAKAYKGEFVESLGQITDAERRYYLTEVQKSVLAMPLESVQFHFRITGVTRGFTHQMVRQRTAAYSQESTRFAVKEDVPVGLPPSLQNTIPWDEYVDNCWKELYPALVHYVGAKAKRIGQILEYAEKTASQEQLWRRDWDNAVNHVEAAYNKLINLGMPAEDARGLLPTNLLTQINYITDLRALKEHAGVRLCTQAQFEWRQVWAQIVQSIREYGKAQNYKDNDGTLDNLFNRKSSAWQFDALADIFRPICYYRGSCQFQADFDRHCSIRDRVQANANLGIPSTEWGERRIATAEYDGRPDPIFPAEWLLDPSAARVK
ncbi:thymidylate synthase [Mycobacterium phage Hawkeye]|uniref:ThyX n=1 Tax=Mycobacterium phage Hawkeye TaxID=1458711 RepID=X2KYX6_9CAUD|nr:thymidylate synthase [Mycobacterium phage Hawkeye]AHN84089.1 ThyX-like thymidylate synthase [Mycobacterium phage Hawkeye]